MLILRFLIHFFIEILVIIYIRIKIAKNIWKLN